MIYPGNDQSPSLRQSCTSILLTVALIRSKAIDILAAALPSLLSSSSQTTRLTTRPLPIPRLRRGNKPLPAFLASTSSWHCTSVDLTPGNGRILDFPAKKASRSTPTPPTHPHPRSHGSRTDPGVDHDLVTAEGLHLFLESRQFLKSKRETYKAARHLAVIRRRGIAVALIVYIEPRQNSVPTEME